MVKFWESQTKIWQGLKNCRQTRQSSIIYDWKTSYLIKLSTSMLKKKTYGQHMT